jgi:hypothetical protein
MISMTRFGVTLDSCEILGVGSDSSLQQIRDAYREKAKKYHPDMQGEQWVFQLVNRAYEILSTARVAMRVEEEVSRPKYEARPAQAQAQTRAPRPEAAARDNERVRTVVRDEVSDLARLVDVELLVLKFAIEDPLDFLLKGAQERNLSCCLNVSWPSRRVSAPERGADRMTAIMREIARAFDPLAKKSKANASWSRTNDDRFEGWLSYPTAEQAREAFELLHAAFQKQGLGVEHWTREMILERRAAQRDRRGAG